MLIYEKKVAEQRKLFAAEGNIPTESDVEVTYKRVDGTELELTRDRFIYQRAGKLFVAKEGSKIPTEEDVEIGVFAGDRQLIGTIELQEDSTEDEEETPPEEEANTDPEQEPVVEETPSENPEEA